MCSPAPGDKYRVPTFLVVCQHLYDKTKFYMVCSGWSQEELVMYKNNSLCYSYKCHNSCVFNVLIRVKYKEKNTSTGNAENFLRKCLSLFEEVLSTFPEVLSTFPGSDEHFSRKCLSFFQKLLRNFVQKY